MSKNNKKRKNYKIKQKSNVQFPWEKLLRYSTTFFLFLLLIIFLINKISDCDIWFHLSTGKYIIESHTIPRHDVFSFIASSHEWIDSQWLFQVILYAFYVIFGVNGPILLQLVVFVFAFILLYKIEYKKSNYIVSAFFLLGAILIVNERFLIRPEMFTLLFIVIYFYILYQYKNSSRIFYIFFLPFLQIVWTNTHGLFIIGVILVLIFLLGELIDWKINLPLKWNQRYCPKEKRIFVLSLITVLVAIACFVNPYLIKGASYPFLLFTEIGPLANKWMKNVSELVSPFSAGGINNQVVMLYKVFIVISAISFILNIRRLNITYLMIYGAFLYVSIMARRNIPLFIFIVLPITIYNINTFLSDDFFTNLKLTKMKYYTEKVLKPLLGVALIVIVIIYISAVISNRYYTPEFPTKVFGFGIAKLYPEKAIDFIKISNIQGNMLNNTEIGGYFSWKCYPDKKVFIDGRWEIYGRDFLLSYNEWIDSPTLWSKYLDKYNINYILLTNKSPEGEVLLSRLCESTNWSLVYIDNIAFVFVRNVEENKNIIEKYNIGIERDKNGTILIKHQGYIFQI